jgi:XTP/dITP diphosphohydrolase
VQKLLLATHNPGKIAEYEELLADLPLVVASLSMEGIIYEVEETGQTFTENACLKARAYAQLSGLWTWADDSGLEVDVLEGRPGVLSARYVGANASDSERYARLLDELRSFPSEKRRARFRCVVAIALPDGNTFTVEGSVEGVIADQPRGCYGFGYDPIFYLPEYKATMAELPPAVKNRISHRGKAAREAKTLLRRLLARQNEELNEKF